MLNGLYAAASGMEAQQAQFDAVSNDLSNVDTPGYQGEELGFHDLLYTSAGPANATRFATGAGAAAQVIGRNQAAGAIAPTNRPLDVALLGPGYLEVRRPNGTIGLTRNGSLQINSAGQITTSSGATLVPPVTVPRGTPMDKISIARDGTVRAAGRAVGRIGVVTVPAPDQLLGAGDGTYSATAASGAIIPGPGTPIQQGCLEQSNVDMAQEMSKMIDAQRSYQMDSRAITMQDQMMQIANQIAK